MKKVLLNKDDEIITAEPNTILDKSLVEDKIVIGKNNGTKEIYIIKEGEDELGCKIMTAYSLLYDGLTIDYDDIEDLLKDFEVMVFEDCNEFGFYFS